jgi:predicted nucleotidyltransferase
LPSIVSRRFLFLRKRDKEVFALFARKIFERFPDARICAFGSRLRGHATDESDLDVGVAVDVLDEAAPEAIMQVAREIGFENDVLISRVTYSSQEFDEGPCSESPLVQNILSAGMAA